MCSVKVIFEHSFEGSEEIGFGKRWDMTGDSRKVKEAIVDQVKWAEKAPKDDVREVTWEQMVNFQRGEPGGTGPAWALILNEMENH